MPDDSSIPYGYCHCGCGEKAPLAPRTVSTFGYVKGEPYKWVRGHSRKKPYHGDGLCECGCGERTEPAAHSPHHPKRFVRGHASRGERIRDRYVQRDMGHDTPCWVWLLCKSADGYGVTRWGMAHRVEYEKVHGAIQSRLELDHLCNVRACVNPEHLEPVTRAENVRRAVVRGSFVGASANQDRCEKCGRFMKGDHACP